MHDARSVLILITGASSGIGLAVARSVPYERARILAVARREAPVGRSLPADLADPDTWGPIAGRVADELASGEVGHAILAHFAGVGEPSTAASEADPRAYAASVVLNAAAGPALGQAFLAACRGADVPATVVLCSSPAAAQPLPGMTHYGAGKSAAEYWVRAVSIEEARRPVCVFAVVPHAVDTPMLRAAMELPVEVNPVAGILREAAARGGLASAEATAGEIWRLVTEGGHHGEVIPVGAVPGEADR